MQQRKDRDGLYKQSGSTHWYASYTDAQGQRRRRSTGTDNRREAEAILAQWKTEAHQQRTWGVEPNHTLHSLILAYIDAHPDKRTLERDGFSVKHLYRLLGDGCILNTLSPGRVHGYSLTRRSEGAAPATVNREIGLLSAALNWARRTLGWKVENVAEAQRMPVPPGRDRWLTQDEAAHLLVAARQEPKAAHLPDFILLALHTGMRTGEILQMEWSRVDLHRNYILLGAGDQKNGQAGSVPLNQTAREVMLSRARFRATHCPAAKRVFCDRHGEGINSIKKGFAAAVKRAGISHCTPHDLRRTCGSWLVQARTPIQEVARLLRHSDIQVTMSVYAHLMPDQLQQTVATLDRHNLVIAQEGGERKTAVTA